jgi:hypothetical protein
MAKTSSVAINKKTFFNLAFKGASHDEQLRPHVTAQGVRHITTQNDKRPGSGGNRWYRLRGLVFRRCVLCHGKSAMPSM